jgi:hypothetical protein
VCAYFEKNHLLSLYQISRKVSETREANALQFGIALAAIILYRSSGQTRAIVGMNEGDPEPFLDAVPNSSCDATVVGL